MAAHAALARRAGVPKVITCRDGDLVRLAPQPGIIDEIPAGRLYKDGSILIGAQDRTVADRRKLGFAGIVSVAVTLSEKGELLSGPRLELTGIPDANAAGAAMLQLAHDSVLEAFNSMPKPRRRDPDAVAESLRRAVRSAIGSAWKKKPICHVHVLTI
jgi:ribonuclease J